MLTKDSKRIKGSQQVFGQNLWAQCNACLRGQDPKFFQKQARKFILIDVVLKTLPWLGGDRSFCQKVKVSVSLSFSALSII